MKQSFKNCLLLFAFFSIFGIIGIIKIIQTQRSVIDGKAHIDSVYSNIQFKGEVLSINRIKYGGRIFGIMCVKIDSTNTNSFYRFDECSCLRIKDGIASMPTNFIGEETSPSTIAILEAVYVEVNPNNSRTVVFINKNGKRTVSDWYYFFDNINLSENDLLICDK